MMATPTVADLKKKTDQELSELLGFSSQVEDFKKQIEEADKLSGKAREKVEEEVQRMLTPRVYPGDLKYAVERAKRKADPKAELNSCSCDILD